MMTVRGTTSTSLLMFVALTGVLLVVRGVAPPRHELPPHAVQDGVKAYYLHGNADCSNCRTIQAYAREAVEASFADDLQSGRIAWEVVNYESPGNEHYADDYQTVAPNVVLVKFRQGKQVAWKGLPEVWEHKDDKRAFLAFVQANLREFLNEGEGKAAPR